MSLSALQLAGTSALALVAGSGDVNHTLPIVFGAPVMLRPTPCTDALKLPRTAGKCGAGDDASPRRLGLDHSWQTRRTATDVLTELLNVNGIRVVADKHVWDRPENLMLRHDFASTTPLHLYCAAGVDRAVYLDSRALSPALGLAARRQRSIGLMAAAGASWRLNEQFNVETDIRWLDVSRDARLMRTDAGWVSGDPLGLTLSVVWRGN